MLRCATPYIAAREVCAHLATGGEQNESIV